MLRQWRTAARGEIHAPQSAVDALDVPPAPPLAASASLGSPFSFRKRERVTRPYRWDAKYSKRVARCISCSPQLARCTRTLRDTAILRLRHALTDHLHVTLPGGASSAVLAHVDAQRLARPQSRLHLSPSDLLASASLGFSSAGIPRFGCSSQDGARRVSSLVTGDHSSAPWPPQLGHLLGLVSGATNSTRVWLPGAAVRGSRSPLLRLRRQSGRAAGAQLRTTAPDERERPRAYRRDDIHAEHHVGACESRA